MQDFPCKCTKTIQPSVIFQTGVRNINSHQGTHVFSHCFAVFCCLFLPFLQQIRFFDFPRPAGSVSYAPPAAYSLRSRQSARERFQSTLQSHGYMTSSFPELRRHSKLPWTPVPSRKSTTRFMRYLRNRSSERPPVFNVATSKGSSTRLKSHLDSTRQLPTGSRRQLLAPLRQD